MCLNKEFNNITIYYINYKKTYAILVKQKLIQQHHTKESKYIYIKWTIIPKLYDQENSMASMEFSL